MGKLLGLHGLGLKNNPVDVPVDPLNLLHHRIHTAFSFTEGQVLLLQYLIFPSDLSLPGGVKKERVDHIQ